MKLPHWVDCSAHRSRQSAFQRFYPCRKRNLWFSTIPLWVLSQVALPAVALLPDSQISDSQTNSQLPNSPAAERAIALSASTKTCQSETQFTTAHGLDRLPQVHASNWGRLISSLTPALAAQFAAPFPQINGLARLAKVPVIMYHDILPQKEVFFDVTPQEFAAALQLIHDKGLTPISLDQLTQHLSTGIPLPAKPILLTFDDGYKGHYTHVYPLLKRFGYPAVFAIYPEKVGKALGRSSLTWAQLREMAADPLVTIASHSYTHPDNLTQLPDDRLRYEIAESKRTLETQLGITIRYFVYPAGHNDERVQRWVQMSGYKAALTMNDEVNQFAGESENLLNIDRIGQSSLKEVVNSAYGGAPLPPFGDSFNFSANIRLDRRTLNKVPLILVAGGKPTTIHANSRYQVPEIIAKTKAVAAVDGGFFSLEQLDSNVMVGPVFSQSTRKFVPSNIKEVRRLTGRPLVLISDDRVTFIPFDPAKHNTLAGLQAEQPHLTDAFVAAAWLVKAGQPQPAAAFGNLFDFNAARDRAFWGIDYTGQPVIGVSGDYVDSVSLGKALSQAGLRDAVMLDSGASASLAYQGKSMMGYEPRPVPHVVALLPPHAAVADCAIVSQKQDGSN
ncbi:MAG TPA: polysaccharide deacetylase family protein [Coleofasciculaceae cyanobacterium]